MLQPAKRQLVTVQREAATRIRGDEHVELAQATHMVAGDANDAFTREVIRFVRKLQQTDSDSDSKSNDPQNSDHRQMPESFNRDEAPTCP